METFAIVLIFCVIVFMLCSLFSSKIVRYVLALSGSLFIVLQSASIYFTQTFIGYQFYVHYNLNATRGFSQYFIFHTFVAIALFWALCFAFVKWSDLKRSLCIRLLSIVCILLSVFAICSNKKFIGDSRTLSSIFSNDVQSFQKTLDQNDMSDYTLARHIVCKSQTQKNLIVLSLESYEKAFIEDKDFEPLTPNLRRLKSEWDYINLNQNIGSSWTSGSIYTYLTGFPAFFGVHGNSIFQTSYHTEIASVSQILKQSGHNTFFLIGNAEHSGLQDMLTTLSIDSIIDDRSFHNLYPESNYGLRDKDLFEIAKSLIIEQTKADLPFAIFISTTDTHAPNGIYDQRMETVLNRRLYKNDLEFMVAAVDFMVGDFVDFLQQNNILRTSTLFVFPDHLKMGNPAMFKNNERGLFLLSNTGNDLLKISPEKPLYQIDLPKLILNGAGIQHNAKFLTDYIGNDINYLENHIKELTAINVNGLLRSDTTRIPQEFRK